uniref:Uncharacterized protein n=1 Tax=Schistocephalus solidus TaxID=70667 RepID=A0A0X3PK88_SCHSO
MARTTGEAIITGAMKASRRLEECFRNRDDGDRVGCFGNRFILFWFFLTSLFEAHSNFHRGVGEQGQRSSLAVYSPTHHSLHKPRIGGPHMASTISEDDASEQNSGRKKWIIEHQLFELPPSTFNNDLRLPTRLHCGEASCVNNARPKFI